MRSAIVIPASALLAVGLAGCVPSVFSGPIVSEEREIDAVTTVVLDTSGDVTITEGEPSLVIHATESALQRLTSEIEGDALVLGNTFGPGMGIGEVRYEITLPSLEGIELNGSGDIESTVGAEGTVVLVIDGSGDVEWSDLAADRVELRISGSGDIDVDGTTTELLVELDGSGDVDAESLEAQEAVVTIGGSGNVSVSARDNLYAGIDGSGTIVYTGDPVIDTEVSGSGEVRQND